MEEAESSSLSSKELLGLRRRLGYTLRDFGKKVGLSYQTISNYEKGKRAISYQTEKQIKEALGLVLEKREDNLDLHVHLDYLRLTFFDTNWETVAKQVLGIDKTYFLYEENHRHAFDGIYSCGSIKVYVSDNVLQGTMIELSGQGLQELETVLFEESEAFTLNNWLVTITDPDYYLENNLYSRFQCSRLDIAIDELYKPDGSNYDLHDLKWRRDHDLIETALNSTRDMESFWQNKPLGLTLYFGSPNGNFLIRMYEKAKERAKKENRELAEVLMDYGVVNRYEMQIREQYAEAIFDELARGGDFAQFAIDMLLSKFEVYEKVQSSEGKEAYQYYKPFYAVFGDFKRIKINGKRSETNVERSMAWVNAQVVGTLAMFRDIFGEHWLYDWLDYIMSKVELSSRQQNIVNYEKMRVSQSKNLVYLWYSKRLKEKAVNPLTYHSKFREQEVEDKGVGYRIRLSGLPSKVLYYIDRAGNYTLQEPPPMSAKQVNDLSLKKDFDFLKSDYFKVYEVKNASQ